jgi:hypothetical protein
MNRFFKWLETKFSQHSAIAEEEELHIPVGVRVTPKETVKEEYTVEVGFDQEMATEPELTILSDSSLDANKSAGVDPYDTGCFDPSKTSGSRSHK